MKVALYARVSTDVQDANQQIKECASLSQWGEPLILIENQSAWKDNKDRPKFEAIVSSIKARKLDHLIVWDLDRIYRNRLKLIEFFKLCKAYGCTIHSYRQQWLEEVSKMPAPWNDIVFDLMLNVMGWLAEEESSKKSDRVKKAIKRDSGKTLSYKGNKWGRKEVSNLKMKELEQRIQDNPKITVRALAEVTHLSVGTVHKYMAKIQAKNKAIIESSLKGRFLNSIEGARRFEAAVKSLVDQALVIEGAKLPLPISAENKLNQPPLNSETEAKKEGRQLDSLEVSVESDSKPIS